MGATVGDMVGIEVTGEVVGDVVGAQVPSTGQNFSELDDSSVTQVAGSALTQ